MSVIGELSSAAGIKELSISQTIITSGTPITSKTSPISSPLLCHQENHVTRDLHDNQGRHDEAQSPSVTSSNDGDDKMILSEQPVSSDGAGNMISAKGEPGTTEIRECSRTLPGEEDINNSSTSNTSSRNNGLSTKPEDASDTKLDQIHVNKSNDNPQVPDSSSGDCNKAFDSIDAQNSPNNADNNSKTHTTNTGCTGNTTSLITTSETTVTTSSNVHNNDKTSLDMPSNGSDSALADEETMRELLNRSDTAIIYPEPVSDHEDDNEKQESSESQHEKNPGYVFLLDKRDASKDNPSSPANMTVDPSTPISIQTNTQLPMVMTGNVQPGHNQKIIINKNSCVKCGATFVLKSQLDKHLLLHSPTSQICSICRKTFANVYRLQRHMISHDESTDLRKFKCTECGKAFKFKHHLKEHVRIHSGEKPFECQNCGKRFSHSGSYSSHMTSKKCWVMGVKMNSGAGASSAGIGGITPDSKRSYASGVGAEKSSDVDMMPSAAELTLNTIYASQLQQQAVAAAFLQYETAASAAAANSMQTQQYLAQLAASGSRSAFLPIQLLNAYASQIPGALSMDAAPQGLLKVGEKTDENQNEKEHKSPTPTGSQTSPTTLVIPKVEKMMEEEMQVTKFPCKFCDHQFTSAVEHHQHERYLCVKRDNQVPQRYPKIEQPDSDNESKDAASQNASISSGCKHCGSTFGSPVELHQHERYLCTKNTDITSVALASPADTPSVSAPSSSTPLTVSKFNKTLLNIPKAPTMVPTSIASSSLQVSEDDTDDQFVDKDGQQYRVRSMITDQQLAILKAKYSVNPRPASHELLDIGAQIGFPKRVVQVWFQNMRARDRRRGKVIAPGLKGPGSISSVASPEKAVLTSGGYATVPRVSYASTAGAGVFYASGTPAVGGSPLYATTPTTTSEQDEPLDLSFKSKTKSEVMPYKTISTPEHDNAVDDGVLNLSMKSSSSNSAQSSSDIDIKIELRTAPLSPISCVTPGTPSHQSDAGLPYASTPGVVSPPCNAQALSSPFSEVQGGSTSLESSFNSAMSMDSAGMETGACSLLNMAKRARLQLDSEGYFSGDGGDSLVIDESRIDSPSSDSALHGSIMGGRKRSRKSWKQHRIIGTDALGSSIHGETGLYSCDQCDKLFSKQSSLARHKYEHSGQRPFACDICKKSFKHKHHLTEHARLHSGEKPFCCKKCGKRFSHSGSFSQHMNHRFKFCKQAKTSDNGIEEV